MCYVALEVAAEVVVVAEAVAAGWDVVEVAATPGSDAAYCFALEVYRGISACRRTVGILARGARNSSGCPQGRCSCGGSRVR